MAELLIDDFIGEDWLFVGITSRYVNRWLRDNGKEREIIVRINSPGGDAIEGVAIYTALKKAADKHRVIVEVEGVAASAASVIAMAGDEIRVHKGAFFMIHEAWGFTRGPAEDHEQQAGVLRQLNGEMADLYAARSGQSREKCLEMMAVNDTWLTAEEAKSLGFCDAVIPAKAATKKPTKAEPSKASQRLLARYSNAPAALRASYGLRPEPRPQQSTARATLPRNAFARAAAARLGD